MRKFCIGIFWLSPIIAIDLAWILGEDLLLMPGMAILDAPGALPADLIVLMCQFNVLIINAHPGTCLPLVLVAARAAPLGDGSLLTSGAPLLGRSFHV